MQDPTRRQFLGHLSILPVVAGGGLSLAKFANAAEDEPGTDPESAVKEQTTAPRKVWLTFDDGPEPGPTDKVLDVLAKHEIPASFFVIGRKVERNGTKLLERMVKDGHLVGNHTFTHPHLAELTESQVRKEIEDCQKQIDSFMKGERLMRPPYGSRNEMVDRVVEEMGFDQVMWSVDTNDWRRENRPDKWVQVGLEALKRQQESVVLMHDMHQTTADHVDFFIEQIKALGPVEFFNAKPPA